uniref:Serpentine receptor class gamma n=1 Tax=Steinernema glaseri TaxID=37863 RepID=A0A1I7ZKV9_9BILA
MPMPLFHYILVIFVAISAVLNVAVLIAILKYRKVNPYLKGSFFTLILFHGVADLFLAIEFTVLMRARKYRYLDFVLYEGSTLWLILPYITNGLHYYLKAVIYVGNILLSFNRFTSAAFSMQYELFWQSKLMISVRALGWILPLAAVLPIVLNPHYTMWFAMSSSLETVRLQSDDESTQVMSYVDGSLSLAATVICFGFYALSAITLSRQMLKHVSSFLIAAAIIAIHFTTHLIYNFSEKCVDVGAISVESTPMSDQQRPSDQ